MNKEVLSILLVMSSTKVYNTLESIQKEGTFRFDMRYMQDRTEAKQYIFGTHPNLIILEISSRFPVWEFMEEIQEKEKHAEVLLISQEKNFELAYQAFQHRAIDFLLMPIDKKALLRCLEEVLKKKKLISEREEDKKRLGLFELIQHQVLMEKILSNMLEKPEELEQLLGEVNERYQTTLMNDNFFALVINTNKKELYYVKSEFCQKVINLIENTFSFLQEVIGAVMEPYGITGIINLSSHFSMDLVKDAIESLYYKILALQKDYGDFSISIGVGHVVHSMKEASISLQEAFRAEQYKLTSKERKIFYSSDIPQKAQHLDNYITISLKKELSRLLKSMDEEGLNEWFSKIIELSGQAFQDFPEGYFLLKSFILQMAKEVWEDKETADYFWEEDLSIRNLEHLFSGERILECLREIILRICQKRKELKTIEISDPVRVAMEYISKNYAQTITLEKLADLCGLSSNYFSALFKEQVGETYIDYLTNCRLEQAQKQLISTRKTVREITDEIGYIDDKYFRKLFKKRYGMTPSQYRNKK